MSTLKVSSCTAHKVNVTVTTLAARRSDPHAFYTRKFKSVKAANEAAEAFVEFPFILTDDWEFIGMSRI